ncbi:MAG: nucleotide exchange factor GrpE [Gammaproteobacteria bacterium]|nr:nucleotide exchange factor GrpE [Gammaproteobacteria bacterium]
MSDQQQQNPNLEELRPESAESAQAPIDEAQLSPEDAEQGALDADADELARQLEQASSQAQQNRDKLMRVMAEMDNLRKRHERDLESAHKYALERFANELLQVRDSLELGHQAAQDEQAQLQTLREGTELTLKLLGDVMQKFGVEQLDPTGQPFNPEQHQAMSMMPSAEHPANTVVQVVQKGYLLNGRLLRPAMVIVSSAA